ncbi:MAG: type IV pilus assembly protein PilM [Nitrospirae bacterium]|nr:type IV pilus assembly protein PilM [Nitrospirota bacterium]
MSGLFRPAPVGVDLGSGSVKVIRLKDKKILLAAFMDIPSSEREDEGFFIDRLRNFFREMNITGRAAAVHIPGMLSFIRTINLPPMPKTELKEAVRWEVKRQLPYPVEDAVYDYVAAEVPEGIVVTFASAEKKNIQRHISPLKEAGLNVISVDVNSLCLIRALPVRGSGNVVVIDIGAKNMEIDIIKSGALRLTRTVEMGGEHIKTWLIGEGISETEAEDILMKGTADKMNDVLNQFLREILRSTDYYKATFKEKTFSEVILTGGVAINSGVKDYFSHMFDIPVSVPNPFDSFVMKDETLRPLGPRFSAAIGLARRSS